MLKTIAEQIREGIKQSKETFNKEKLNSYLLDNFNQYSTKMNFDYMMKELEFDQTHETLIAQYIQSQGFYIRYSLELRSNMIYLYKEEANKYR